MNQSSLIKPLTVIYIQHVNFDVNIECKQYFYKYFDELITNFEYHDDEQPYSKSVMI